MATQSSLSLPAYDSVGSNHAEHDVNPPAYTPPAKFKIGPKITPESLVSIKEIKGHLALLYAFSGLRKTVEETTVPLPNIPTDNERKWAWFVGLAVERFDRWCMSLKYDDLFKDKNVIIPPIDVVMVWHSYMLNPRWYTEDSMRINACKHLTSLEDTFCQILGDSSLSRVLFSEHPDHEREQLWQSRTSLPFSPFDCMTVLSKTSIKCPQCDKSIQVDLMTAEGMGYLQQHFSVTCNNIRCRSVKITKESLAYRKLVQDLCTKPSNDPSSHLPGTLFPPLSRYEGNKSWQMKQAFCESAKAQGNKEFALDKYNPGSSQYERRMLLATMKYGQNLTWTKGRLSIQAGLRLIPRVMSAYQDNKIYSVELVGATLRQAEFVRKMFAFGWTDPEYFVGANELALYHALTRYHAFSHLMNKHAKRLLVPTLDIDLVWHTHQLMPTKYAADCTNYIGHFVDHDDKVEGLRLLKAFESTCSIWKETFDVPYTYCGCPLPRNFTKRTIDVVDTYGTYLTPPERPDLLASTHASDHNAVRYHHRDKFEQDKGTRRYLELDRSKKEQIVKMAAAPTDGANKGAYDHHTAFLVPIPFYNKFVNTDHADCVGGGSVVSCPGGCSSNVSGSCGAGGCTGPSGAACSSGGIGGGCG